jgi:tetratricopeptide (TPR) repeat protein
VDFGLAKSLLEDEVAVTVSIDGETLGTPAYMSPEQAAGDTDKVDTRTDVYSMGVLLFGQLTGENPHDLSGSRHHVLRRVAEKPVKRPRRINPKLDKDLEFLLLKSLDNDPDRRYTSAGEMARDIDNYLRGAPLIAGPESGVYQIKKFIRRNLALVAGVAVVLTVLIAGIIVSTVFAIGQARARAKAEQQEEVSRAVTDFLTNDLLASASPHGTGGPELTARLLLDMASEKVQKKFGDKPIIEASIRSMLGSTYRLLRYFDIAEQHLEQALQVQRKLLGEEHPDTLRTMHRIIRLYAFQSRYKEAEPLAVKVLETRRRVLGEEHEDTLISMFDLAWMYRALGRYEEAEPLHTKNLQMTRRILDEEHPHTSVAMKGLGALYRLQGRFKEAEKLLTETVELELRVWGEGHPSTLDTMSHLALVYEDEGRYDEAEAIRLKVLSIKSRILGEEHPHSLLSIRMLIKLYEAWGKPAEAEKWRAKLPQTEAVEK